MSASRLAVGYKASAEQFGPRDLVELAILVEQHGMEGVLVNDHFQPLAAPRNPDEGPGTAAASAGPTPKRGS